MLQLRGPGTLIASSFIKCRKLRGSFSHGDYSVIKTLHIIKKKMANSQKGFPVSVLLVGQVISYHPVSSRGGFERRHTVTNL